MAGSDGEPTVVANNGYKNEGVGDHVRIRTRPRGSCGLRINIRATDGTPRRRTGIARSDPRAAAGRLS